MTSYSVSLGAVFAAGMVLGFFYFAVLRQTVRRLPETAHPARLLLTSLLIRVGVVVPAFYLLMAGHWERIAVALGGFVVAREILIRLWGREKFASPQKGAAHGHPGPE